MSYGSEETHHVARPKHIANICGEEGTLLGGAIVHGWDTSALLREMAGLESQATFENVEIHFHFT